MFGTLFGVGARRRTRRPNRREQTGRKCDYHRHIAFEPLEDRRVLSILGPQVDLFGAAPAMFVENQGQWADEQVRFLHQGNGANVAMTDAGVMFEVFRRELAEGVEASPTGHPLPDRPETPLGSEAYVTDVLQFSAAFVGAGAATPVGLEPSGAMFNYLVGPEASRRSNVPAYEVVAYEGLYDGVDLHARGLRSSLKYEFHVAPGANWSQIAVRYDGIAGLSIAEDGSLVVDLGGDWGMLTDDAPYIYQVIDGQEVEVAGRFELIDPLTYSFAVTGSYDAEAPLVVDPNLAWLTYLGGSGEDGGMAIAVDASGSAYVTGSTASSGLETPGVYGPSPGGALDAFVAKFSADGSTLEWFTYLGGSSDDVGRGIAVDASGNVYVTGMTSSDDMAAGGTHQPTHGGLKDAFVAKLGPDGSALEYFTYLGGSADDAGYGIAVDASGSAYVTGMTQSQNLATAGAHQETHDGSDHAFLAKLDTGGTLVYFTYLGGSGTDSGTGVAIDASGNAYVTGYANSTTLATAGAHQYNHGGSTDAFVAKFSADGSSLAYFTYLGGKQSDYGYGIAVDSGGHAYVTGSVQSDGLATPGAHQGSLGGGADAFVAKLDPAGENLVYFTYLGGEGADYGSGITVDAAGNAHVVGTTASDGLATPGAHQGSLGGGDRDAFVAKFDFSGTSLLYATYLGGSGADYGEGIAVDAAGSAYVTGRTYSDNLPAGGHQPGLAGASDAFVAKLVYTANNALPVIANLTATPTPLTRGEVLSLTASGVVDPDGTVVRVDFLRWHEVYGWSWIGTVREDDDGNEGGGVWTLTGIDTTGWALGEYTLFARAQDNDGARSRPALAMATVVNIAPEVTTLIVSPDPVTRGDDMTLTALGVADEDGQVVRVDFYRDANGNGIWDEDDEWLGFVLASGTWTFDEVNTAGWDAGEHTLFARALDNDGGWSEEAIATVTVENVAPVVVALIAEPDPVPRGDELTLTAEGVADPDGTVVQVRFYRDANGNGFWDEDDELLGEVDANGEWVLAGIDTSDWDAGEHRLFARALDDDGAWSVAASTTVEVANAPPVVDLLIATPDRITRGDDITLTAEGVSDPDGFVERVSFYRDTNGNGVWDDGDVLLGTVDANGDWVLSGVSTAGWDVGENTLFARAQDNDGDWSEAAVATVTVESIVPFIEDLLIDPNPVTRGDELTLTATGVSDPDGEVVLVEFYRDTNGDGLWDENAELLGTAETPGDWTLSDVDTLGWAAGGHVLFARAQDDDGVWSDPVAATVVVENVPPEVAELLIAPDPVTRGHDLTLTADGVTDFDGQVVRVSFYLDTNGGGVWDEGDELLRTVEANGDWVLADVSTAGWTLGTNTLFARAQDDDGDWGEAASATVVVRNAMPVVGDLVATPDPVLRGDMLTLSATGVFDPDGEVVLIDFFRWHEVSGLSLIDTVNQGDAGDLGDGAWRLTDIDTSNWDAGEHSIMVMVLDNDWDWTERQTTVWVQNINPTLGGLSVAPDQVTRPGSLTLTADGAHDVDGEVVAVHFYHSRRDPSEEWSDAWVEDVDYRWLGIGTYDEVEDVWTFEIDATDRDSYTAGLDPQEHRFFARAQDNDDGWSNAVSDVAIVENALPEIAALAASPDPVVRPDVLILTAEGVYDPDGEVAAVHFYHSRRDASQEWSDAWVEDVDYRSLGTGVYDEVEDVWTFTIDATARDLYPTGVDRQDHRFFARAEDADGAWSAVAAETTVTIVNAIPTVESLSVAPDPVTRGHEIALTAEGMADADGEVVAVHFYRDTTGDGVWDEDDEWLGEAEAGDAWTLAEVDTLGWALGTHTLFARAQDNDGAWSEPVLVTLVVENALPVIGEFTASPNPVTRGHELTLTVTGVFDPDGEVTTVDFLRYLDGTWTPIDTVNQDDPGDSGEGTWVLAGIDTAGWALGEHELTALVWDNDSGLREIQTTVWVENAVPEVAGLTVAPDPATRGDELTLTAEGVGDSDGEVERVVFYRDTNGDGEWDEGDVLLGTVEANGPWVFAGVDTAGWAAGEHTLFARAQDNDGGWSEAAVATVIVENIPPVVESLLVDPDPVARGEELTLTAEGVTDPDRTVDRVAFYRDSNDDGEWDEGDELLDVVEAGGDWVLTGVGTSSWTAGEHTLFARAQDDDGDWSEAAVATVVVENVPPVIEELLASPDPVPRGDDLTLTAEGVSDPDGNVVLVNFYYDTDGNGVWDEAEDELLETVPAGGDWTPTAVNTAGWALGEHTFFARAQDDDGAWSAPVSVTVTVENAIPVIAELRVEPDPVVRGNELTLTALGVSDQDGKVELVSFYRDTNGNGVWDPEDERLGTVPSGSDWFFTGIDTSGWAAAEHTLFARAQDNDFDWSEAVSATVVVENIPPVVESLQVDPDPVTRGDELTLTAEGVSDADGTVDRVAFYRDTNGNGVWDDGDELLGTVEANGPWVLAGVGTSGWAAGEHTLFARAQDDDGDWSTEAVATVVVENIPPVIEELLASPDPVPRGDDLTLTAAGVNDADGQVELVNFYYDTDGNGVWDEHDALVGTATAAGDGWTFSGLNTAGWALGEHTLFARAQDDDGDWSEPVAVTVTVENALPVIAELLVDPDPVTRGHELTLTALGVSDQDGEVELVSYYRDTNGNGMWDDDDQWLGSVPAGGDWALTNVGTAGWALGEHTLFARALDNDEAWGAAVSATVVVENALPTIASLAAVPDPITRGHELTLTATGVSDSDGAVERVRFYRDINGNGVWDPGDAALGTIEAGNGWVLAGIDTMDWALGENALFARAQDNDGGWSAPASTTVIVENAIPVVAELSAAPDPVTRGHDFDLTAGGVTDPDGTVELVSFYRDTNGNGVWDPEDEALGTVEAGDGWTLPGVNTAGWALGSHTLFARALDDDGAWSAPVSATVTVENDAPFAATLAGNPDPVTRGHELTLTAGGVGDSDGEVVLVDFLRWHADSGSSWLGTVSAGDSGDLGGGVWRLSGIDTLGWELGQHTVSVVVWDNDGAWGVYEAAVTVVNAVPTVAGLTVAPDPVPRTTPITLTAEGVNDPDREVVRVAYYRDTNGNGVWDAVDELLGTVEANAGWALAGVDTTGWTLGQHTLFTRVQDSDGAWSAPAAGTVTVLNAPPVVGEVVATPAPVPRNDTLTLTAVGVTDPDGQVARVAFYRGGELLGIDEDGSDGWSLSLSHLAWSVGEHAVFAQAQDDYGTWGALTVGMVDVVPTPVTHDLAGRAPLLGDWWISASNRFDAFSTERTVYWSTGTEWLDVMVGDFTGNGFDDIVGRSSDSGDWFLARNDGTGRFVTEQWGRWSPNVEWLDVHVGDFSGDGRADIVGRVATSGDWWIARATDHGFVNERWGRWSPNVEWVDVMAGDFNGDGRTDLVGRVGTNGDWWVARSNGGGFVNQRWGRWSANVEWLDVMAGDFNGDGRTDLVGRVGTNGDWWVAQSNGGGFVNQRWGRWSANVEWLDVMVGDFNGDGQSDLVGRVAASGDWWVAQSNGGGFVNQRWGRWSANVQWVDVMVGDFNGDARSDLVGRVATSGDWWVAESSGAGFDNARWGNWASAHVAWSPALVGNFAPTAAALHAEAAPAPNAPLATPLAEADLQPIVEEAIARMSAEVADRAFQVRVTDLPGLQLGLTVGTTIYIDHNAAGFGWYLNTTDADFQPGSQDGELTARAGTDAVHRIDLLTVVMHELGHLHGYDHAEHGLMQPTLAPGVRHRAGTATDSATGEDDLADDRALRPERLDAFFATLGQ